MGDPRDTTLKALVETITSRENVRRAIEKLLLKVTVEEMDKDEFKHTLEK
ncbi:MAG: hypothetical protein JXA25_05970 [Anaerolineales bacterium]|nr:hypothetical protein [Anaerolineales bacterium]